MMKTGLRRLLALALGAGLLTANYIHRCAHHLLGLLLH